MMSKLKWNMFANFFGQGWTSLIGIIFIPFYIRYIGIEAYGLVGLFGLIQAWLSLLDMGMTPALTREMARFTAGAGTAQSIGNLLRSLEFVFFSIALLVYVLLWQVSDFLAEKWLNAESIPISVVAQSLSIMGLIVALRFCESMYRGSLLGLQKQVHFNILNSIVGTIRHVGALGVLIWLSPTIQAFFIWQGAMSLLSVILLAIAVYISLPNVSGGFHFSLQELKNVWRFAGGVTMITVLSLLLTNVDKILLSKMLTLKNFGYYTLATTIAGVLYMTIGPVYQAVYPRTIELITEGNEEGLASIYHQTAQTITILTAPAMVLLVFFSQGIVFMWSGNIELANGVGSILSVLVIGTFLNAMMWVPYGCQLAYGWTSLMIKTNLVAVLCLVPAIFFVVPKYGAIGAAYIWIILNLGYIMITVQIMHRKILPKEKWKWYLNDVFMPLMGAFFVAFVAFGFQPEGYSDRISWFCFLLVTGACATLLSLFLSDKIRDNIILWCK